MAINAANHYITSEAKPSIFEIIAQKSLNVTLQPALRKLAEVFASSSPKKCWWMEKYYDEVFLILNGMLQCYYLKNRSSSFSEYFYGLKRVRLDDYEITMYQKKLSWLYLVIIPYLKAKIEQKLANYRIEEADQTLNNDFIGKLKKTLILLQSTFELSWGLWILTNYLRYMSNKCEPQLPSLKLLNLKLIYSNNNDDFQTFWSALFRGQLSVSELSVGLVQNAVRSVLEISAFFVQFLQAWNAEKANFNVTALPVVEPPPLNTNAKQYKEKCPICLQYWKIPTVLPVSGYVFCFTCIYGQLREHGKCPVTNLPSKPLDVIRLYQ